MRIFLWDQFFNEMLQITNVFIIRHHPNTDSKIFQYLYGTSCRTWRHSFRKVNPHLSLNDLLYHTNSGRGSNLIGIYYDSNVCDGRTVQLFDQHRSDLIYSIGNFYEFLFKP